ncbi:MAG: hypothetical protein ACKV2V_21005, partial [Blastocatellia bacterium]
MKTSFILFGLSLFITLAVMAAHPFNDSAAAAQQQILQNKVAPWLLDHLPRAEPAGNLEFLVIMSARADLTAAGSLDTKLDKSRYVRETLWQTAKVAQADLRAWLKQQSVEHQAFYIVNAM